MLVCEVGKNTKLGKRDKNDHNRLAFFITKGCGDESREKQGESDLLKIKSYSCGQMEKIKIQCPFLKNKAKKM